MCVCVWTCVFVHLQALLLVFAFLFYRIIFFSLRNYCMDWFLIRITMNEVIAVWKDLLICLEYHRSVNLFRKKLERIAYVSVVMYIILHMNRYKGVYIHQSPYPSLNERTVIFMQKWQNEWKMCHKLHIISINVKSQNTKLIYFNWNIFNKVSIQRHGTMNMYTNYTCIALSLFDKHFQYSCCMIKKDEYMNR